MSLHRKTRFLPVRTSLVMAKYHNNNLLSLETDIFKPDHPNISHFLQRTGAHW